MERSIVELLGRSALFGSLSEADRAAIAARMRRVQFEPDQMIFSRGDPGREIYLVIQGRIRLSVLSSDGRELSLDHAAPGGIFGEIATLDGGERTAGATAISRVEAMSLPQRALMELIESNPKVAMAAVRFLCTRLRETDQRLEAIALHRIEVRLARLMLSALRIKTPNVKGGQGAPRSRHVAGRAGPADRGQPAQGQRGADHARGHGCDRPGRGRVHVRHVRAGKHRRYGMRGIWRAGLQPLSVKISR